MDIAFLPHYRVALGGHRATEDLTALHDIHGISHIVSLGLHPLSIDERIQSLVLDQIMDVPDENLLHHLPTIISFVNDSSDASCLIHCVHGQSRSAFVVIAYLMLCHQKELLQAYKLVLEARHDLCVNPGFLRQLALLDEILFHAPQRSLAEYQLYILAEALSVPAGFRYQEKAVAKSTLPLRTLCRPSRNPDLSQQAQQFICGRCRHPLFDKGKDVVLHGIGGSQLDRRRIMLMEIAGLSPEAASFYNYSQEFTEQALLHLHRQPKRQNKQEVKVTCCPYFFYLQPLDWVLEQVGDVRARLLQSCARGVNLTCPGRHCQVSIGTMFFPPSPPNTSCACGGALPLVSIQIRRDKVRLSPAAAAAENTG